MTGTNRWWAFPWDDRDANRLAQDSADKLVELDKRTRGNERDEIAAIAALHRQKYIGEIVLNENDVAVADDEVERIISLEAPPSDRLGRKIYNLGKAVDFLFQPDRSMLCERADDWISVENIKQVHEKVMTGLLDSAGTFRTFEAAPTGYDMYYYKSPMFIETSLSSLCAETKRGLADADAEPLHSPAHIKKLAAVGGDFLGKFLDIHPFANGNGRVGRLLLSCLLAPICIVPVSLNIRSPKRCRSVYLDTLEQARWSSPHDYSVLHVFVLEAAHRSIAQLHWMQSDAI